MDREQSLEMLLHSFERYYNIHRNEEGSLFAAEAEFHTTTEQYFLIHQAKLSEQDSNEYVYFALADELTSSELEHLAQTAWQQGTARVEENGSHRSTDVTLMVLADRADEEALKRAAKISYYKSYRHSLNGWSHFRLVVAELSSGRAVTNRQGRQLKKLVANI